MNTIKDLLHTAASQFGTRVALIEPVSDGAMDSLTYHALLERAQGFAGALQEKELEKEIACSCGQPVVSIGWWPS